MNISEIFGHNVKKYRDLHNLSQEELAFRLSVNLSNITRIEAGAQFVTAETLQKIVDIFNIEPSKLFEVNKEDIKQNKKSTNKEKLIKYIEVQTEEDSKYFLACFKQYIKHIAKISK